MLWNKIFTYTGEYFDRSSFSGVLLNNVEKGDSLICMRRTCTKTASKECGECSVTALFLCLLWSPAQCSSWITAPQTARTRMELRTDWRSSSPDGPPWKRYRKKALLKVKDLPCALRTFTWCSLPTLSFIFLPIHLTTLVAQLIVIITCYIITGYILRDDIWMCNLRTLVYFGSVCFHIKHNCDPVKKKVARHSFSFTHYTSSRSNPWCGFLKTVTNLFHSWHTPNLTLKDILSMLGTLGWR